MRKRKFHLTDYEASGWSICGQHVRDDNGDISRGVYWEQLKSKCKITCKTCRKSWYFGAALRIIKFKKTGHAT